MIVIDAGTTWSKIIETSETHNMAKFERFLVAEQDSDKQIFKKYIMPSNELSSLGFKFDFGTGHLSKNFLKNEKCYENEIIALVKGAKTLVASEKNLVVLDLGSRDAKRINFQHGNFHDLDWNSSCSSSTGVTVEMLLKFYNLKPEDLVFTDERYVITCGIFGLERIMDDIASGSSPTLAVSKFVHGIAFNAWNFAQKPEKLYLSGGFCANECFVNSLSKYCEVTCLGRFVLASGSIVLAEENAKQQ